MFSKTVPNYFELNVVDFFKANFVIFFRVYILLLTIMLQLDLLADVLFMLGIRLRFFFFFLDLI